MQPNLLKSKCLLEILRCPNCYTALQSFSCCDSCGLEFVEDGGTPVLLPGQKTQTVSFNFSSDRSVIDSEDLSQWFTYPSRSGKDKNLPYHLDRAHCDVIENLPKNSTILEIGCGGGQMRDWVESMGHQYIGIDIAKTRVFEWLRSYGGPNLLCDSHFLPFQDNCIDLVFSAAVVEHIACPTLTAQEIERVLKPGGYYVGTVAFLEPWHDDSFFHMSPLGVIEHLTQANIKIKHVWPESDWSGYEALMVMGNHFTQAFSYFGKATYAYYQLGNHLKTLLKKLLRHSSLEHPPIWKQAQLAGSIAWIANKA